MVVKISSKNQVTIPKDIARAFDLKKGDILEVERKGNKIIMVPKEVILEDKYPIEDLEAADKALSGKLSKEEVSFDSDKEALSYLRNKIKK